MNVSVVIAEDGCAAFAKPNCLRARPGDDLLVLIRDRGEPCSDFRRRVESRLDQLRKRGAQLHTVSLAPPAERAVDVVDVIADGRDA